MNESRNVNSNGEGLAGEQWVVYDPDGKHIVRSCGTWQRPHLPPEDDLTCFSIGRGDDSNVAGFNFRYIVSIRHHKPCGYWRLKMLVIHLDTPAPGHEPDADSEERLYPDECLMEDVTLAELVTSEQDPRRAVTRLLDVYMRERHTLDWSCVSPEYDPSSPLEKEIRDKFYEAEASWYEKHRKD